MGLVLLLSHWFGLVFGHKIIKKLGKDLWPAHTEGGEGSWMVVLLVTVAKYLKKTQMFTISF